MSVESLPKSRTGLDAVVRQLLDSAPPGIPSELLRSLGEAMAEEERLPPGLFRAVVEQSPLAVSITDLKANILYCNDSFNRVTGYRTDEVIGSNESKLSDKRTPLTVYRELWSTIQEQRSWSGRLINRRKDGSRYLAEVTIAPVLGDDGSTSHYLGMHRDITAEYTLDKQVQNQKALIESMINASPMSLVLLDETQQVVLDNLAYKTLRSDFDGMEIADAILAAHPGPVSPGRDFQELELRLAGEEGTRWFICSGNWFREQEVAADAFFEGGGHDYLMLSAREVTEQRRYEERQRRNALSAMLAEESQNQALSEALEGALYQLRGPLNMLSAARAMAERRGGDESLRKVLGEALEAGEQALATLQKARPRRPAGEVEMLTLADVLRDAVEASRDRLREMGVTLHWNIGSDSSAAEPQASLRGDGSRLRGLFKQLIDNAIEAMSEVETRHLSISCELDQGYLRACLEDTGPGIDEALRLRVFQPFFSTREGHSGMGLAWVQDVVNQHAGTVSLENRANGGCRACVALPPLAKGYE